MMFYVYGRNLSLHIVHKNCQVLWDFEKLLWQLMKWYDKKQAPFFAQLFGQSHNMA